MITTKRKKRINNDFMKSKLYPTGNLVSFLWSKGTSAYPTKMFICQERFVHEMRDIEYPYISENIIIGILIHSIKKSINTNFAERIENRINFLLHELSEDPEEPQMQSSSLGNFLSFIRAQPNLKCPEITVSNEGNIVAMWREREDQNFHVEFLPSDEALYFIFSPGPTRTQRIYNQTQTNQLWEEISPYKVNDWAIDNEGSCSEF